MNLHALLEQHPLPALADADKRAKPNVVIVGGPPECPGSVVLAATAALRLGAGRLQAAVDPAVATAIGVAVPEAAVLAWNQAASPPPEIERRLASADVVVIGSGCQRVDEIVTRSVAARAGTAVVILDAGATTAAFAVAGMRPLLLAPNPTEARALLASDDDDNEDKDDEWLARALAERLQQPVAVRGEATVIVHGSECWRFDDAPPGLGTPGSGDVFVGALAALAASGIDGVAALGWAVSLHADAGRRLSEATPVGYLARDLVSELPYARAAAARHEGGS